MTEAPKLKKLTDLLSALKPGETARIGNQDLVDAEISTIAETDLRARAESLESGLPFRCEIIEAIDGFAFIFRRPN